MNNSNSQSGQPLAQNVPVVESGASVGSGRTQTEAPALSIGREIPEWHGKTNDSKVPDRVRLRIFQRYGGKCYLSGRVIRPGDDWQLEHIVPLIDGGKHAEGNLAPALVEPHKVKSREEAKRRAKERRIQKKHIGIGKSKKPMPCGRDSNLKKLMDGRVIDRRTGEQVWPRV